MNPKRRFFDFDRSAEEMMLPYGGLLNVMVGALYSSGIQFTQGSKALGFNP
jgi:hypothetical protein